MILTVTFNPAVDHTAQLDEPLEPGTISRAHDAVFDAAGKGINVTKYLAGLGVESLATGPVGGFLGTFVETDLDRQDVQHDFVTIDGLTRLNMALTAPEGEYKVNLEGPEVPDDIETRLQEVVDAHDPDILVLGGSLPPGMDAEVIDTLAGGRRTVLDVHGEVLGSVSGDFFLAKPNREELGTATGMPVSSYEEIIHAADRLRQNGIENVLVSLGADGALLVGEETALRAEALDVTVADTVGAGDALVAGTLAGFMERQEEREWMLKKGVAAASRVVSIAGVHIPDFGGIDKLAETVTVEELR